MSGNALGASQTFGLLDRQWATSRIVLSRLTDIHFRAANLDGRHRLVQAKVLAMHHLADVERGAGVVEKFGDIGPASTGSHLHSTLEKPAVDAAREC